MITGEAVMSYTIKDVEIDEFTEAYLVAALWSSNNIDSEEEEPLDENYDIADFSQEALMEAREEVDDFRAQAGDLLDDIDEEMAGHDFWLTRNGHGTGFWDRGYPTHIGDRLSDLADQFGEQHPIVGDDGELHWLSPTRQALSTASPRKSPRRKGRGFEFLNNNPDDKRWILKNLVGKKPTKALREEVRERFPPPTPAEVKKWNRDRDTDQMDVIESYESRTGVPMAGRVLQYGWQDAQGNLKL